MIVGLQSVCGAPGVSWTTHSLALLWPSPVMVVEADLWSSFYSTTIFGGQVPSSGQGLAALNLLAARGEVTREDLFDSALRVPEKKDAFVLSGMLSHVQGQSFKNLWSALLGPLVDVSSSGVDVLVDFGRFNFRSDVRAALFAECDYTAVVSSSSLASVTALARAKEFLVPGESKILLSSVGAPYPLKDIAGVFEGLDVRDVAAGSYLAAHPPVGRTLERPFWRKIRGVIEDWGVGR